MLRTRISAIAVAVGLGLGVGPAAAATLTFDTQIPSGPVIHCPAGAFSADCSFSEGLFDFTSFGFLGFDPHVADGAGGAGTIHWHAGGPGNAGPPTGFDMALSGGGLFDLVSLDIFGFGLSILADYGSGFVAVGEFGPGNQVLNLSNLAAVRISNRGTATSGIGFDNVSVANVSSAPIPEPATLLLLGSGLAAAGIRRRMKRRG